MSVVEGCTCARAEGPTAPCAARALAGRGAAAHLDDVGERTRADHKGERDGRSEMEADVLSGERREHRAARAHTRRARERT
eukprot:1908688-Prymnesium_polylepis.2